MSSAAKYGSSRDMEAIPLAPLIISRLLSLLKFLRRKLIYDYGLEFRGRKSDLLGDALNPSKTTHLRMVVVCDLAALEAQYRDLLNGDDRGKDPNPVTLQFAKK